MKKRVIFMLLVGLLAVPRGYGADEAGVSPEANRILNLWCESQVLRNFSFDLNQEIEKVLAGQGARVFQHWDVLVKHVELAEKDEKNPWVVKFGSFYVLSESRRRVAAYLMELASAQMVPILGGIQKETDAGLKRNAGYGDRFRFVLSLLNIAREVMNSGEDVLDQSPDREAFKKLKRLMMDEIDFYKDVVAANMDRVYAWGSLRDDSEKKMRVEKAYAAAQRNYQEEILWIRRKSIVQRLALLKKYGLDESRLGHGGDLLDRYADKLIQSEKQYDEKYF